MAMAQSQLQNTNLSGQQILIQLRKIIFSTRLNLTNNSSKTAISVKNMYLVIQALNRNHTYKLQLVEFGPKSDEVKWHRAERAEKHPTTGNLVAHKEHKVNSKKFLYNLAASIATRSSLSLDEAFDFVLHIAVEGEVTGATAHVCLSSAVKLEETRKKTSGKL